MLQKMKDRGRRFLQIDEPEFKFPKMQHTGRRFLQIDEPEFKFPIELNKPLSSSIILKNISDRQLAFRIRSKSPNASIYSVHPLEGFINSGDSYFTISATRRELLREEPSDMITSDMFVIECLQNVVSLDEFDTLRTQDYHIGVSFYHLPVQDTSPKVSSLDSVIQSSGSESITRFLRELESDKLMSFTHEDLGSFTSNFAPENKIGFGGFAVIYRGRFPNGVPIAVKVLRENDVTEQTFMAEVSTMAKAHHRYLVKLYGYCFQKEKKAMVYEYMENGSLDNVLFNNHLNLPWEKLYVIAIETAKALSYLHDGCMEQIIHYDVKPGNVLLDSHHSSKLTDFGIAKLMNRDRTHATLTGIRGTVGYTAPEVWMPSSEVTYKCDVYSFSMMLFEVLGRSKNERKDNWFPKQVWEKFKNGQLSQLIEDCGIGEKDREKAEILSTVALWCAQFEPTKRPRMSTVVNMLEKEIPVSKPPNPFPF